MFKPALLLIFLSTWFCQNKAIANGFLNDIFFLESSQPDTLTKAAFPEGHEAFYHFLKTHLTIPPIAYKLKDTDSHVVMGGNIEVEINAEGKAKYISLKNQVILPNKPEVIKAVRQEFARVINEMPLWTPALKNGKPMASKQTLSYVRGQNMEMSYEEYLQEKEKEKLAPFKKPAPRKELRTKDGSLVYTFLQKPPVYPDGENKLKSYLINNFKYLQQAPANPIGKKISQIKTLGIIINKEGVAEEIILLHPEEDPGFNYAEAQALLTNMPKWKPGMQGKKYLSSLYTIPFSYQ